MSRYQTLFSHDHSLLFLSLITVQAKEAAWRIWLVSPKLYALLLLLYILYMYYSFELIIHIFPLILRCTTHIRVAMDHREIFI